MAGYLTTHVLDTSAGTPAVGLAIELYRIAPDGARALLARTTTNQDGRTDAPILPQADFATGEYELVFHAGDYLQTSAGIAKDGLFIDLVPLRFRMTEASHYHVPLLLSPFAYSTYRGS